MQADTCCAKRIRMTPPAWATLLCAAALVAGCAVPDIPRTESHAASAQKKAQAVHHWDVLADDVAARIADKISEWPAGEHPIHVPVADASPFAQGFRKLLLTRLLDRGVTLSSEPTHVALWVETQVVQHPSSDPLAMLPRTRLADGVDVSRDWPEQAAGGAPAAGAVAAAQVDAPAAVAAPATPGAGSAVRTEVLVTTSLESGKRYLARTADIYYLEPDDATLFLPAAPPPPPRVTPLKTWKVTP